MSTSVLGVHVRCEETVHRCLPATDRSVLRSRIAPVGTSRVESAMMTQCRPSRPTCLIGSNAAHSQVIRSVCMPLLRRLFFLITKQKTAIPNGQKTVVFREYLAYGLILPFDFRRCTGSLFFRARCNENTYATYMFARTRENWLSTLPSTDVFQCSESARGVCFAIACAVVLSQVK